MGKKSLCRTPYHEEYIRTRAGNSEGKLVTLYQLEDECRVFRGSITAYVHTVF